MAFPSGAVLDLVKKEASRVRIRHTYVDSSMRISRNDADGKVFVFTRPLVVDYCDDASTLPSTEEVYGPPLLDNDNGMPDS